MGTSNPVNNWIFLFLYMRIVYLHTSSLCQEIKNLVSDIIYNFHSNDCELFELKLSDTKYNNLSNLIKIRRFVKKNKIDIIHAYHFMDAYYAILASKGLNTKVVYSTYSFYDNLSLLHRRVLKFVLAKADALVFLTDIQKNLYLSKYKLNVDKVFKLIHAFSIKRLENVRHESIRDEFFIDDFRYLIGTVCDFSPAHDIMNIFKMVKKLKRSGRNFTCVISGNELDEFDSYFDECKYFYLMQGLDNYITITERRDNEANFISQLDIFVYHSDYEVVALPVIEAMMMGINVVVNDNDMIREITHNGKYATLYKSQDAADFSEKTRNILLELDDYKIIAETVKEECRDIFSIERHIAKLNEIYRQIIK